MRERFGLHPVSIASKFAPTSDMRTKVTLVLVFLNVALFFFIFKFERHWQTERALDARRRVFGPEAADIRSLEITSTANAGSFSLARRGETRSVTRPLEWPANPP